jgi:hypothetical protein
MKAKRIKTLVEVIPPDVQTQNKQLVPLSSLKAGLNTNKAVVGVVVNIMVTKGFLPV